MSLVRLDKIASAYNGNLESVVHNADMANGSFVMLGGLVAGERELRQVAVPTAIEAASKEVLLVASPELSYDALKKDDEFVNKANKAARAYHLSAGDIFTVTDDMISGATAVGKFVEPIDGLKLGAADAAPSTRFAGIVLEKTTLGFDAQPATVIQVLNA